MVCVKRIVSETWRAVPERFRAAAAIDTRALSAFRFMLATILLCDLAVRAQDIQGHYTDLGVLPLANWRSAFGPYSPLCFFVVAPDALSVALLFVSGAVIYLLLLLGRWTPLVTLLAWLFLLALHQRNPLLLNAGDSLLRLLLFWAIFVPLDGRWKWWPRGMPKSVVGDSSIASGATAALLLQVCYVYWNTAYWKSNPDWWSEADAVSRALNFELYATGAGDLLLGFPEVMRWMSRAVLIFEWIGPTLAILSWNHWRLRAAIVMLFVLMHLSLAMIFTLGLFPYVSIAGWILFLPSPLWERAESLFKRRGDALSGGVARDASERLGSQRWKVWLLGILLLSCVTGYQTAGFRSNTLLRRVDIGVASLGLLQSWSMYAHPSYDDGWFEVEGVDTNGEPWDLLRMQRGFVAGKPKDGAFQFANHRWRKYMNRLRKSRDPLMAKLYAHWQCFAARAFMPAGLELVTVRVGFIVEFGAPPPALRRFVRPPTTPIPLGQFACGGEKL